MLTTLKLNDTLVSKLERRDNNIISFERLNLGIYLSYDTAISH